MERGYISIFCSDDDQALEALALISEEEAKACTKKVFIPDGRLSLGSALLKRLFVSKSLGIPWDEVKYGRRGDPKHGKPAAVLPDGSFAPIDFNVSHQNGLVALVGWRPNNVSTFVGESAQVGVDIVCDNERNDYRLIDMDGFDEWIDVYEEIFSDEERWDLKYHVDAVTLLDGQQIDRYNLGRADRCVRRGEELTATTPSGQHITFDSDILIEAKLRRFYVSWCYKEAYIKLTGEALLAPWLKNLEFHNVRSPQQGVVPRCSVHGVWGEKIDDVEVFMHGKRRHDVKMAIQALEEHYMIATAVRGEDLPDVPSFESLNTESDILAYARNNRVDNTKTSAEIGKHIARERQAMPT